MNRYSVAVALAATALCSTAISGAGEMKGAADGTSKWMIDQETAWAAQECGHKSILADLLADDFRGTSPKGERYDKPQALAKATSDKPHATDCRLLHTDVRFFGPDTAIIYGSETALETTADGKPERYCLIWTDTWLKRNAKWQIVAAQDALFTCPAM
jgi:uncharacterized protein DUF4440